ncbi:MAG: 2OG-Fe(II) oxygenase family protein [Gammaproteobacteria bacterium]|nr:2OG-Fe(II) oxygenase family protein [Gammaproteobacteria bacterium]
MMHFEEVINQTDHPIATDSYQRQCQESFDQNGVLVLKKFLTPAALDAIVKEGNNKQHLAFYTSSNHNVYLTPSDSNYAEDHTRNQNVTSSKGCITDDQIDTNSPLRSLYDAEALKEFLAFVLGEDELHPYADPLSSINLHYASEGQELGWHFDNSSFAITLLIQSPEAGGEFEYIPSLRDSSQGDMNFAGVQEALDNKTQGAKLTVNAGDLVLFRGRDAMHRVTPTQGDVTRMLVVLAYNAEPNVSLSESARMTFFGRLQ